jgi:hypothetical protein
MWHVRSRYVYERQGQLGRIRIRCSAATESGTCSDPKTFYLNTVEKAVLGGLTAEMRRPDVIAEYVRTYHEERKRLSAEADASRSRLERQLGELTRDIERLVDAIAKGHGDPAVLGPRSTALYQEKKRIMGELDAAQPPMEVIALHPAVLSRYEEQLTNLQEALDRGTRTGDSECAEACGTWLKPSLSFAIHPNLAASKLKSSVV